MTELDRATCPGDHTLRLQDGVPAVAIPSQAMNEPGSEVAHTPQDPPERVDPARPAGIAAALRDLALRLGGPTPTD